MSRLNKKSTPIICSILGFEPRFQKDEIASGELMYTVWKNTQLATQIRDTASAQNWLFCRLVDHPRKKIDLTPRVALNPLLVCKKQFSQSLSTHISKHHCSSPGNSKCDTCDNAIQRGCFSEELIRGRCHSVCRSFTTRQSSQATLHGRYFNGYERILAVPQKWYLVVFRRKAATRAG